jgi:glucose/arabinose dehydrogenase
MRRRVRGLLALGVLVAGAAVGVPGRAGSAPNPTPATGFSEEVVAEGLTLPTAVRFSPDGRIFVAEQSGLIKVFDGAGDPTPTTFADLRTRVFAFSDRGLLGLELHPDFPSNPSVYVLYSHDAAIGGTAPRWSPDGINDECPSPPAPSGDGCVTSSRLSRLTADGATWDGTEDVFIEDWCQQFEGHSIGTVVFGNDGMLYAGGGDGALASNPDYGQRGGNRANTPTPPNPCGDPPGTVGTRLSPPTAEGGSLRSQDIRTPNDPQSLDGTIIRVHPDTGAAAPGNPLASSPQPNARRIIAYGLRNPFRFTPRPGTDELWIGDVGLKSAEEIDVLRDVNDSTVENFGWPCYEGAGRQTGFDGVNLNLCESLYTAGGVTPPHFSYATVDGPVVPGEACPSPQGAISGITFYDGGSYPAEYDGALFFTDYTRQCIWSMPVGDDGDPDPADRRVFMATSGFAVDLQIGPNGDIYYVDILGGRVVRISYTAGNQPPQAVLEADPTSGALPLTVDFDATGSTDADGDPLGYAWDLDGDGQFDDSTSATPSRTYTTAGNVTVRVRVRDGNGGEGFASTVIRAGNRAPAVTILTPTWGESGGTNVSTKVWGANGKVSYSGRAIDPEEGTIPASRMEWRVVLHHCTLAGACHEHHQFTRTGVSKGTFTAPDHEYPAHLEIILRATDSQGLVSEQRLRMNPRTVTLEFHSSPKGLRLNVDNVIQTAPFRRTMIYGSRHPIAARSPQEKNGVTYRFAYWKHGGGRAQEIVARDDKGSTKYMAVYRR